MGIEISDGKIICGGNKYLSIIEPSFWFKYKLEHSIDLEGFISNIIEFDLF